jgi:catechol 2,3-dioxygenase-like lactoylglutathione lyase family enzyme
MAKIRHIAYRSENPEAMVKFFTEAFDMKVALRRERGAIDLTDGTLNITILPMDGPGATGIRGIEHIGFTVADDEAARRKIVAAGGKEKNTLALGSGAHYEVKFEGPEGIVVDIGHWAGTAPIDESAPAESSAVA